MALSKAPLWDPTKYPSLSDHEIEIVRKIYTFAEQYFQDPRFDASHDFAHVQRVTSSALTILKKEEAGRKRQVLPALNPLSVILGALLHDVEDKKYVDVSNAPVQTKALSTSLEVLLRTQSTLALFQYPTCKASTITSRQERQAASVRRAVVDVGLSEDYAEQIHLLVEGVSYSSEVKDPERVEKLIKVIPELAIVQDADRLDAIGAIGIGRCFTYGGAKGARSLEDSLQHFEDKLLKLESMMKTEAGRAMAEERSSRIRDFIGWWKAETQGTNQKVRDTGADS